MNDYYIAGSCIMLFACFSYKELLMLILRLAARDRGRLVTLRDWEQAAMDTAFMETISHPFVVRPFFGVCVCLCAALFWKRLVITGRRLDSGLCEKLHQSVLMWVQEAGFYSSRSLPTDSKPCVCTWSVFPPRFIPLLRKPVTKQIPGDISRNKPYHG